MKDISNHTFSHLFGLEPGELKTTSRDKEFLTGNIIDHNVALSDGEQSDKIFEIASITKTFSAATIVSLASKEQYKIFFDESDPLGTKISIFEPLLQQDSHKKFFQELKDKHPNYEDISIRNLLNHTSGIMDDTWNIADQIRSNPQDSLHIEDHYRSPVVDKDKFGEYSYANPPYDNVLRPIIEAVTGEKFSDVVRREIIEPQGLNHTLMFDQAKDNLQIVRGADYYQGRIHLSQSHNFDSASGGMAASATDVQTFFQRLISRQVFNEKGNALFFDERNFMQKGKKAHYGLGIERETHGDHQFFSHGGACFGGYSYVYSQKVGDEVKTVATVLAYENITRPIAAALIGDEKIKEDGNFYVDETLARKMKNLRNYYNDEQLIEMRSWLEKDADKSFEERSQEFKRVYEQRCLYNKGLNPTTPEFSSYVNNSSDWKNIGQEMDSFIDLQHSPFAHESVDTKGYLITCMFKLAVAVKEGKDVVLSEKVQQFLDNIEGHSLTDKIKTYGDDIIAQHQDQHNNASALSSVASVYGVRAYMVHKRLLTDEEIAPASEPQKYFDAIPEAPLPENTRKNLALAMENFEKSAELGNVRSMGSVVMWAQKSQHPDFDMLNQEWTPKAATATFPSPNSMIDYGDMFQSEGNYDEAIKMFETAASFGLDKAKEKIEKLYNDKDKETLENINMMQEDTYWTDKIEAQRANQSNQNVR